SYPGKAELNRARVHVTLARHVVRAQHGFSLQMSFPCPSKWILILKPWI
ncbi:hypothetical protein RRG08_054310, partial [Elysia crispata]